MLQPKGDIKHEVELYSGISTIKCLRLRKCKKGRNGLGLHDTERETFRSRETMTELL